MNFVCLVLLINIIKIYLIGSIKYKNMTIIKNTKIYVYITYIKYFYLYDLYKFNGLASHKQRIRRFK